MFILSPHPVRPEPFDQAQDRLREAKSKDAIHLLTRTGH